MSRRRKPDGGWADEVRLLLTQEDVAVWETVALPGEPKAHTYLRVAREALPRASVVLRYRKAPLFPQWMQQGPMNPVAADQRGRHMLKQGFEVVAEQIEERFMVPLGAGEE